MPPSPMGVRLVFGLIRLARRLIGPVPGALVPRCVRAEIRTALRLGEALYRQAVLLMAADLQVRLRPLRSSTHRGRRSETPRALPLLDPLSYSKRTRIAPEPGRFGGPEDTVPLGHLPARLDRLERAFTDPVRRARRLAFRLARRKPSPTRLRPPSEVHLRDWPDLDALRQSQRWLRSLAREAVFAPP